MQITNVSKNEYSEQNVLGGMISYPSFRDYCLSELTVDYFHQQFNRNLFQTIIELTKQGLEVNTTIIYDKFIGISEDEKRKFNLLRTLMTFMECPLEEDLYPFVDSLIHNWSWRQIVSLNNEMEQVCNDKSIETIPEIIDFIEKKLDKIKDRNTQQSYEHIAENEDDFDEILLARENHKQNIPVEFPGIIYTGITEVDEALNPGLNPSELVIIGGRPGMGKTTYALNIALNVGIQQDLPVLLFTPEMPKKSIKLKLLSCLSGVNHNFIKTGVYSDEDEVKVLNAMAVLRKSKIYIDDTTKITPEQVRTKVRMCINEHNGVKPLVVFDYLQLATLLKESINRANDVSKISREFKAIAKDFNLVFIAMAQLSRNLESRQDKSPLLSDLKESGGLEQDADLVLFPYRESYYDTVQTKTAQLIIAKSRMGFCAKIDLYCDLAINRFSGLEKY